MMNQALMAHRGPDRDEALLTPIQNANSNPRLEFRDGQMLFAMTNQEGGIVERFISDAAAREAFSRIPIDSGWLRPEIVRWGDGRVGEWAVAFFPPALYQLEITNEKVHTIEGAEYVEADKAFELERITVPLPGLVFFGLGTKYYLWAVKTPALDPYREIYRAPLPNVYGSGEICWGLVKPPRATARSIFDAWELFIKSTFNNHLSNGKSKQHKEDVRVGLREFALRRHEVSGAMYPLEDLIRQVTHTGVTLHEAIKGFFETGEMPG